MSQNKASSGKAEKVKKPQPRHSDDVQAVYPAHLAKPNDKLSESAISALLLEYEQLRQEILHNDSLTLQIIGAVLILTGALIPVSFAMDAGIPHRWVLFLVMETIAFLGLLQNTDRLRGTLIAASYIKVFIESKIEHIKWETRLQAFRDNRQRGGDLIMHQVWVYAILILGNFYFASYFFLTEYQSTLFTSLFLSITVTPIHMVYVGLTITALLLLWQFYISVMLNRKNTTFYDKAWYTVRDAKPSFT